MGRLNRIVLISTMAVGLCGYSGLAQESPAADSKRDLAKWVLESRGQVQLLTDDGKHVAVKHVSQIPDASFAITRIDLGSRHSLSNQDLEKLEGLSDLEELNLSYTRITDAGLKSLKGLPKLSRLYLAETKITDASLAELSRFENLASLDLSGTKITDKNVGELAKLKKLSRLFLGRTEITGEAVKPLSQLKELAVLHLAGVQLSGEELTTLKSLGKLEEFSLSTDDEGAETSPGTHVAQDPRCPRRRDYGSGNACTRQMRASEAIALEPDRHFRCGTEAAQSLAEGGPDRGASHQPAVGVLDVRGIAEPPRHALAARQRQRCLDGAGPETGLRCLEFTAGNWSPSNRGAKSARSISAPTASGSPAERFPVTCGSMMPTISPSSR